MVRSTEHETSTSSSYCRKQIGCVCPVKVQRNLLAWVRSLRLSGGDELDVGSEKQKGICEYAPNKNMAIIPRCYAVFPAVKLHAIHAAVVLCHTASVTQPLEPCSLEKELGMELIFPVHGAATTASFERVRLGKVVFVQVPP